MPLETPAGEQAPVEVTLAHAMPGRVRLRLLGAGGAGLEALAAALSRRPGVLKVAFRTETGSLLVLHDGRFRPELDPALRLVTHRHAASAPRPRETRPVPPLAKPGAMAGAAAFSGLALLQMARGRVLPPALTLFWYAATLFGGRSRPPAG
ncbi:MAG: hypothetical protein AB1592_04830 [Pseudomonadota bacterium]